MHSVSGVATAGVLAVVLAAAAASAQDPQGYLAPDAVDSIAVAGPPPAAGSEAEAVDLAAYRAAASGAGSARWALARADDDIDMPTVLKRYACALDADLTPQTAPGTVRLLSRTLTDASVIPNAAKKHYNRPRPFAADDPTTPLCVDIPAERRAKTSSTYPSGHATLGTVWGLVLTEAAPGRSDQIAARTATFVESRQVCRLHYPSDLAAGQRVGQAIYAQLTASPEYRADLAAAKAEIAAAPKPAGCGG